MNAASGADAARRRSRRSKGKGAAPGSAKTSGDFWGSPDLLPSVSADPSAVVRSLGRPPFPGHEAVSEYYLRAVYDNTAKLAEVLATAGDLLPDPGEPD